MSTWVVFTTGKLDFSSGSEDLDWEKDCKNEPAKAILLHVAFSLKVKGCIQEKRRACVLALQTKVMLSVLETWN